MDVVMDTDPATAEGELRTTPVTSGQNIGTAHLAVLVNPTNHPSYTLNIKLHSGADYLEVTTQ